MERLTVRASYTITSGDNKSDGMIEFVARICDSSKGINAVGRARRAVARRIKVRQSDVEITGVMTY